MRFENVWLLGALAVLVGCVDGQPPLDELPLRDALLADPAVIAAMPPPARSRLAARLEAARASDEASDELDVLEGAPGALVTAADRAREKRQGEPLLVGVIGDGRARALTDRVRPGETTTLPPLEGAASAATAPLESGALAGEAGGRLRDLLVASGARRLRRVVGWPIGAVAIADTVYVNASWLVALAPGGHDVADAGADAPPSAAPASVAVPVPLPPGVAPALPAGAPTSAIDGLTSRVDAPKDAGEARSSPEETQALALETQDPDGGVEPPPPSSGTSFWDACSACGDATASGSSSCDSTDDGSDDSCSSTDDGSGDSCSSTDDGSGDSCSSTDDGSGDSCSGSGGDGADAASCQVARGGRRGGPGTLAWLTAPLGYLLTRRRR